MKNVDFVVVRESTEGEYCGEEHESVPGVVESLKVTTLAKSERIARFAFDYAAWELNSSKKRQLQEKQIQILNRKKR